MGPVLIDTRWQEDKKKNKKDTVKKDNYFYLKSNIFK